MNSLKEFGETLEKGIAEVTSLEKTKKSIQDDISHLLVERDKLTEATKAVKESIAADREAMDEQKKKYEIYIENTNAELSKKNKENTALMESVDRGNKRLIKERTDFDKNVSIFKIELAKYRDTQLLKSEAMKKILESLKIGE